MMTYWKHSVSGNIDLLRRYYWSLSRGKQRITASGLGSVHVEIPADAGNEFQNLKA